MLDLSNYTPSCVYKSKIIDLLGRGELEKLSFILFIIKDGDIFRGLSFLVFLIF